MRAGQVHSLLGILLLILHHLSVAFRLQCSFAFVCHVLSSNSAQLFKLRDVVVCGLLKPTVNACHQTSAKQHGSIVLFVVQIIGVTRRVFLGVPIRIKAVHGLVFHVDLLGLVLTKVTRAYGILLLFKGSSNSSVGHIRLSGAEQCNSARMRFLLWLVLTAALTTQGLRAVTLAILHALLRPLLRAARFETQQGSRLAFFCTHESRLLLNIACLLQLR